MTIEEAYQILDLDRQAQAEEVKRAYRRQALRWHPDRCRSPGQHDMYARRFRKAKEAYELLRREGYPELMAEPVPEPDFSPKVAGRRFTGEAQDVPLQEKLGLKVGWSLDSVVLWGVIMPAGAVTVVLFVNWLFKTASR